MVMPVPFSGAAQEVKPSMSTQMVDIPYVHIYYMIFPLSGILYIYYSHVSLCLLVYHGLLYDHYIIPFISAFEQCSMLYWLVKNGIPLHG